MLLPKHIMTAGRLNTISYIFFIMYNTITGYLDTLLHEIVNGCQQRISQNPLDVPEPLCSAYERPDKLTAVQHHRSRFNL